MKLLHFPVVLEQDEDGMYVASVPTLKGCLTQGASVDEAMANIREAIELALEVRGVQEESSRSKFIGLREVEICLP